MSQWNEAWDATIWKESWTCSTKKSFSKIGPVESCERKGGPSYQAWKPWFRNHGGFRFVGEDLFIDEAAQKVLYQWRLEWPSPEKGYEGKPEKRRGLDVIHFHGGKIHRKSTYAKTTLEIDGQRVKLAAVPPG